jgi:hypothetical protein
MYTAALETVHVAPKGDEFPAFSYARPADWLTVSIPGSNFRFDDPKFFRPLVLVSAPDHAVLFTIGVRPVPAGSVTLPWLTGLCRDGGVQIEATRECRLGNLHGLLFNARHGDAAHLNLIRKLYVDAASHLFDITAMAPPSSFGMLELTLSAMVESFRVTASSPTTGWTSATDGAVTVFSNAATGARIRAGRLPYDGAILDKLAVANPGSGFNVYNSVRVLSVWTTEGWTSYFVTPAPEPGAMVLTQLTVPSGPIEPVMDVALLLIPTL